MKEKFKLKDGRILYIIQDEDPMNPRTDWDPLSHMVCWHRNYHLGDNAIKGRDARKSFVPLHASATNMFCEIAGLPYPDEIRHSKIDKIYMDFVVEQAHKKALILKLGLIDHSGLSMYMGGGSHWADPGGWDSGTIGFIYMSYEEAKAELMLKKGENLEERMRLIMEGEVETYDQYLRGEVYGFRICKLVKFEKKNLSTREVEIIEEEEDVDSCWGFFGSDPKESGIYEAAGITQEDILEEVTA